MMKVRGESSVSTTSCSASPTSSASLAFYVDALGLAPVRVDEWRAGEVLFPSVRVDAHDDHRSLPA